MLAYCACRVVFSIPVLVISSFLSFTFISHAGDPTAKATKTTLQFTIRQGRELELGRQEDPGHIQGLRLYLAELHRPEERRRLA